jgi:hypothetical protein
MADRTALTRPHANANDARPKERQEARKGASLDAALLLQSNEDWALSCRVGCGDDVSATGSRISNVA